MTVRIVIVEQFFFILFLILNRHLTTELLTVVPMMHRHTKAVQCSLISLFKLFADVFPIIYKSKDVTFEMNVAEQFSIEFLWESSPSVFLPPWPRFSLHGIFPVPTSHEMAAVYWHVVLNDRSRYADFAVVHGAEISNLGYLHTYDHPNLTPHTYTHINANLSHTFEHYTTCNKTLKESISFQVCLCFNKDAKNEINVWMLIGQCIGALQKPLFWHSL